MYPAPASTSRSLSRDEELLANAVFGHANREQSQNQSQSQSQSQTQKKTKEKKKTNGETPAKPEAADTVTQADTQVAISSCSSPPSVAWVDLDDRRRQISLASSNRLHKLRKRPLESSISGEEYQIRLRTLYGQFSKPENTKWAEEKWNTDENDNKNIEENPEEYTNSAEKRQSDHPHQPPSHRTLPLPVGPLDLIPQLDANSASPSNCVIRSCSFHPNSELFCSSGFDQRVKIFQLDGARNSLLESIYLEDFPVHKAEFYFGGDAILATSRRKHFYSIDVASGRILLNPGLRFTGGQELKTMEKFVLSQSHAAVLGSGGYMHFMELKSQQWNFNLKMNGEVRDATFDQDGNRIWATGTDGIIVEFDIRNRKCVNSMTDEGAIHGSAIQTDKSSSSHPHQQFLFTGNDSGILNYYRGGADKPEKSFFNLTTAIDHINVNVTNELALFASQRKRNAIRFIHIPSLTVISNFPTANSPIGFVSSVCFSPDSKFLTIGNQKGRVLLYKINHF